MRIEAVDLRGLRDEFRQFVGTIKQIGLISKLRLLDAVTE